MSTQQTSNTIVVVNVGDNGMGTPVMRIRLTNGQITDVCISFKDFARLATMVPVYNKGQA